jgi:VIT1/CCC1 family predicted Fe2+/Mn2+ transporter
MRKALIIASIALVWLMTGFLIATYAWLESRGVHSEALQGWCGAAVGATLASFPIVVNAAVQRGGGQPPEER